MDRETIRLTSDLDDDDYNNILILEKEIEKLICKGIFSPIELDIINGIMSGKHPPQLYYRMGISKATFYKYFKNLCGKIAFSLGGYFTDDGYIKYFVSKYNLDENQENLLKGYIKSEFRHKIPLNLISKRMNND